MTQMSLAPLTITALFSVKNKAGVCELSERATSVWCFFGGMEGIWGHMWVTVRGCVQQVVLSYDAAVVCFCQCFHIFRFVEFMKIYCML